MIYLVVLVSLLYHYSAPPHVFFNNVVLTILRLSQTSFRLSTKSRVK
ncbi:hypothetical protein LINPERPRIM_LOCUS3032 [Linum perenne]